MGEEGRERGIYIGREEERRWVSVRDRNRTFGREVGGSIERLGEIGRFKRELERCIWALGDGIESFGRGKGR